MDALGLRQVRRVVVFVVGMTVLLFGVVLIVLPGPAFLVIPAGLAILAIEFRWARRWLQKARAMLANGKNRIVGRGASQPGAASPPRTGGASTHGADASPPGSEHQSGVSGNRN